MNSKRVFAIAMGMILMGVTVPRGQAQEATAPAPVAAEIKLGKLEIYPTYSAVGIELSYEDDGDANAIASFVWRKKGETAWRNGVDMTIDRKRHFIWASIWPLEQNENIEIKITVQDAGAEKVIEGSTTTRKIVLEPIGGNKYYVSPNGDDSNPGTKEKPFKTIAFAATRVQPGDFVYAMSGIYKEGQLLSGLKGTPEKPIVFAAAPAEKPILDSSLEIPKQSGVWKLHKDDIYVASVTVPREVVGGYVAQDGKRMFYYSDYASFEQDTHKAKRVWFYDKAQRQLFVRTGDDKSPEEHAYNVAQHNCAFMFGGTEHVVLNGLEMRNYAQACVRIVGGVGNVLINNKIHHSECGITIGNVGARDNVIWHNEIYEVGLSDFSWDAIKRSNYGRQGVNIVRAGRGNSINYNKVHGWFDCVVALSWKFPTALELNRDMDIMFNELYNAGDDAVELDGGGVNMRFHGNRIRNAHSAISLAPIERGPVYVTRNDATYQTLMFKLSVGGCTSYGWTYCYHNSGYAQENTNGASMIRLTSIIPIFNKVFKNNAIIGSEYAIRDGSPGNIFDYNCYFNTPNTGPRKFHWKKPGEPAETCETIELFREVSGQEMNGIYANPMFVSTPDLGKYPLGGFPLATDASIGDMRLQPNSPCIDKGVVLRGINEDFKGSAPDIGAFEFEP